MGIATCGCLMHTTTSSTDNVSDFLRNFGPEDSEAKLVRSAIREWLADGSGQLVCIEDLFDSARLRSLVAAQQSGA